MQEVHWHKEPEAVTAFLDLPHAELILEGLELLEPNIELICMKRDLTRAIQALTDED